MYALLESLLRPLLKLPEGPPEMPRDGHTRVDVFRASPRFMLYLYLKQVVGLVVSMVALLVAVGAAVLEGSRWALPLAVAGLLFLLAMAAVLYVLVRLDWELRYYIVTDKSLRIREGAWTVSELTLTYANVQNVSVEQGPVERWLGLANVTVDTAGGGGGRREPGVEPSHRGVLRGIDNAPEVRDLIRARLGQVHRQAGLGEPEDEARSGAPLDTRHLSALREVLEEVRRFRAEL